MNRWTKVAAVFVPVGAAITVLTSWACAGWGDYGPDLQRVVTAWPGWVPNDWPPIRSAQLTQSSTVTWFVGSRVTFTPDRSVGTVFMMERCAVGWPMRAMVTQGLHVAVVEDRQVVRQDLHEWGPGLRGGFGVPSTVANNLRVPGSRRFPLWPIVGGFLADTLVYGGAAWGLAAGLAALYRCARHDWFASVDNKRRSRGLCPTCAYDRRGLAIDAVCPECGEPASPSLRA